MRTFARCAGQAGPGRATLNHPYRRCALLDPLQSHFDTRLSWPPPTMAKKVFDMISRRLVLPIEFVRLHFCFFGARAIKVGCCGRILRLLPSCYSVAIQLLFQLPFSCYIVFYQLLIEFFEFKEFQVSINLLNSKNSISNW